MKNSHLVPTTKLPQAFYQPNFVIALRDQVRSVQTFREQTDLRTRLRSYQQVAKECNVPELESEFSILVRYLEYGIARDNPPIPAKERNPSGTQIGMSLRNDILPRGVLSSIRKANANISSLAELEAFCEPKRGKAVVTRQDVFEFSNPATTVHQSTTKDGEWYTPTEIIETARLVMGSIDLDPASSVEANKVVGATRIYTQADDGLSRSWSGNVWLNPPFTAKECRAFTTKTADSYLAGDISQAIVLVQSVVDTDWAQYLLDVSTCICFHAGRPNFWRPSGSGAGALFGHIIYGLGVDATKFIEQFRQFGVCWRR